MRTKDGRFVEERILLDKELLREIIYSSKLHSKLSWQKFALKIGVSSITLQHDWLLKNRTIPKSSLIKLIEISGKNKKTIFNKTTIKEPFWGQKVWKGKSKFKKIIIPDRNSIEYAEFYGIMLGDGCVFSNLKGISITGNKFLDYFYHHNYLKELIYKLFKVYPALYISKKDKTIRCIVKSTLVAKYLEKEGIPVGIKYDKNTLIPDFIFQDKDNLAACIRGVMDTDGSLSAHPHSKIMIHLSITIKSLRVSIQLGLRNLGI